MQVGTFLGEELYELGPNIIAESGKYDSYLLPVPASEFIRNAFLAELKARGIGVDAQARLVSGELVRFGFPCQKLAAKPPAAGCSMRFRFTVRDHGRAVFERTYEPLVTIERSQDQPESALVGQAFVQLLARVFSAFLDDPDVVALYAATSSELSAAGGPSSSDNIDRGSLPERQGLQRQLKDNRIYFELFGRVMMGIYYDRKVLEYGYVGLGTNLLPPMDHEGPCDPDDPCGSGGIWAGPFVGLNSPNLMRSRLFVELGVQKELVGVARPTGVSLNYSLGFAFQAPGGFDLQVGCTRYVPMDYSIFCMPRIDLGKAF